VERPIQGTEAVRSRSVRVPDAFPGLVGSAPCWIHAVRQIDGCYRAGDWLAVEGEPGVGKLAALRAVHRLHRPSSAFRVVEPPAPDGLDAWLADISEGLAEPGAMIPDAMIVFAHADRLGPAAASAVAALLTEQLADLDANARPRVAMTLGGPAPAPLQALFQRTVEIPALRHHVEDLAVLVPCLLGQLTRDDQLTCSPQVLARLGRLNWPGNVAQLRRVLRQVVKQRRAGAIGLDDLPPECRSASRRTLSPMEAIERDAIVNALISTNGSPAKAATALGISRATVYRKLRAYGIRLPLSG
jgi:transcriptional regulator with GAF, ATPase, and Fis domain